MLLKSLVISFMVVIILPITSVLAQHSSPSYRIEESFIGPGGLLDSGSSNYTLRASLGDTGVGNSASASYQIYGGYTTTDLEYLEVFVPTLTVDLGVQSPSVTAKGSATFYVRSYLSHGYVVTTMSQPPTNNGSDVIDGMVTKAGPTVGQEEFGINLAANSILGGFGASPDQIPDNTFSFGYATTDYSTPDQFKYVPGNIIAQSDSSSGVTEYTISYIMNIAPLTPAGEYRMDHDLVVTATF